MIGTGTFADAFYSFTATHTLTCGSSWYLALPSGLGAAEIRDNIERGAALRNAGVAAVM